jgi:elongation factor G
MKVYEGTGYSEHRTCGPRHNSGKTQLAAAILYASGATNRLTKVDEGNTVTDFDDESVARKNHDFYGSRCCRVAVEQK